MHDRLVDDLNDESCAELIESIRLHGQKHPALGRPIDRGTGHQIELIYGARRLHAARQLGIRLRVEVRHIDDRAALVEMDAENRIRADISSYERGLNYARWIRNGHFKNQVELARALGISESQVSRVIRYAELPAVVVGAFHSPRDITESWARLLATNCCDPEKRAVIMRRARELGRSSRVSRPRVVFDILMKGASTSGSYVKYREREDVIKSSTGEPLFRVGYRSNTVHLVLPRDRVGPSVLDRIAKEISAILESQQKDRAALPMASSKRIRESRGHTATATEQVAFVE